MLTFQFVIGISKNFFYGIIGGFYLGLVAVGTYSRKYMRGVADFLVAGRGMRKYLGYAAGGAADVGAISVVASMEALSIGGPALFFIAIVGLSWGIFIGKTGFVVKRVRETRILTMPQLFEMRYSKGVRILAGIICAISGILNMGKEGNYMRNGQEFGRVIFLAHSPFVETVPIFFPKAPCQPRY